MKKFETSQRQTQNGNNEIHTEENIYLRNLFLYGKAKAIITTKTRSDVIRNFENFPNILVPK